MSKKSAIFFIVAAIMMIGVVIAASPHKSIEDEAIDFYEDYLLSYKKDITDAVSYVYFDNEWESDYYVSSPKNLLLEYSIIEKEVVNDSLVAFLVEFETVADKKLNKKTVAYNFVAQIDSELRVITNARNIPEALRHNFDENKYQKALDNNEISFEEVMLFSGQK